MAVGMSGLLVLTIGLAMAAPSSAAIYKVGDASGWTILGNINYTDWTTKKTFHVGDIVGKFSLLSLPSCRTFFEYHY
ncbi:mavicyanin-like [Panicum miliaceum]|uniref:Mavicyanin-like n=1 Tax=Panicum miliaceum TaxID=4540 RepID=A0A3L6SBB6_PANMI|nr:mavicyanin-like [Panicum miliaceum]